MSGRQRRTQSWGNLDHIARHRLGSWPEFIQEPALEEKAASVFTVRLSKRDRDRLERLRAKLGATTLNGTVRAAIRMADAVYCPEAED